MKKETFSFEILGKSSPYIGSEDNFQMATKTLLQSKYPALFADAFHVPNGGKRKKIVAAKMKKMGTRRGVSDWIILQPRGGYHGLIIELKCKTRSNHLGRLSPEQKQFLDRKANNLYLCFVCYSIDAFIQAIENYLLLSDAQNQKDSTPSLESETRVVRSEEKAVR